MMIIVKIKPSKDANENIILFKVPMGKREARKESIVYH
jgi:hypothetical protein